MPDLAPRLLSEKAYETLRKSVTSLVKDAQASESQVKIAANWKIGRRITTARLSQHAGYHNQILRDLADDCGLSVRVLQEAVTFHKAYETPPTHPGLTWSHYRHLMALSPKDRKRLEALAVDESWKVRDLSAAINALSRAGRPAGESPVERPTDPTYLYRATSIEVIDGDTIQASIDLGFQVTRHQTLRLARVDAPEIKTPEGRRARDFLTRALHKAKTMVLTTERIDLHGRYVAHLFLSQNAVPILTCFDEGTHLNSSLIQEGHALFQPKV